MLRVWLEIREGKPYYYSAENLGSIRIGALIKIEDLKRSNIETVKII